MPDQAPPSRALAEAVALCRPEVVCACPTATQASIVEALRAIADGGALPGCAFVDAESEAAALSAAIGASAAGARAYTATSGQGLLSMAEAVYEAADLGLPVVMTIANRAIGAPFDLWNDHSDSMSMRDAGWIQLYPETGQEALDLHIQAFRLAEELACPAMVCVDGFLLDDAGGRVDVPAQADVDLFLPPFEPRQVLDPSEPVSIGATVGPEAFTEMRYLAHHKQLRALSLIPQLSASFAKAFGRASGGLVRPYRTADAETIVVALGSINGAVREVVDTMRQAGEPIGSVSIGAFRPFPVTALREALQHAKRVVVLEKCLAVGLGGIVSDGVRRALSGIALNGYTVIAGLGGRAVTRASLEQLFADAGADELEQVTFLDLNADVVAHELEREARSRRTGPTAEAILRRLGGTAPRAR
ncbi:MAG: pyruvate ferredoxin oxidoreductase [Betaproteobacteria bacterium]